MKSVRNIFPDMYCSRAEAAVTSKSVKQSKMKMIRMGKGKMEGNNSKTKCSFSTEKNKKKRGKWAKKIRFTP